MFAFGRGLDYCARRRTDVVAVSVQAKEAGAIEADADVTLAAKAGDTAAALIQKSPKDAGSAEEVAAVAAAAEVAPPTAAEEVKSVKKRQIPFDYYNLFLDYAAYDYYDWVCSGRSCQLCDVLTGDCCDPVRDRNCFLPDSCANNPCLSGGTCISTRTIGNQPDFSCVCKAGLTGKYCQLVDEFAMGAGAGPAAPFAGSFGK